MVSLVKVRGEIQHSSNGKFFVTEDKSVLCRKCQIKIGFGETIYICGFSGVAYCKDYAEKSHTTCQFVHFRGAQMHEDIKCILEKKSSGQ